MQSNRLVVTLNKDMEIGFERGLKQVYENSNLVNEFVVKPTFELEPKQSLWVAFRNAKINATVTLKPTLLAERKTTVTDSEQQEVDNDVAQMPLAASMGYEYATLLPKEIMRAPDTWYFSIEICQTPEEAACSEADVEEYIKKLQIKTSDVASFTVYSSLAGDGPNGSAPSDLDVLNLYNSAVDAAKQAQETAETVNASNYAPYIDKENGEWYQYDKASKDYVNTGVSAQGPQGIQGPQGERGPQGEKGEDGTSFKITGTVSDVAELPAADESMLGTAYYVGTEAPRNVYSLVKDEQGDLIWQNQGNLKGPIGPQGPQGERGEPGKDGSVVQLNGKEYETVNFSTSSAIGVNIYSSVNSSNLNISFEFPYIYISSLYQSSFEGNGATISVPYSTYGRAFENKFAKVCVKTGMKGMVYLTRVCDDTVSVTGNVQTIARFEGSNASGKKIVAIYDRTNNSLNVKTVSEYYQHYICLKTSTAILYFTVINARSNEYTNIDELSSDGYFGKYIDAKGVYNPAGVSYFDIYSINLLTTGANGIIRCKYFSKLEELTGDTTGVTEISDIVTAI